MRGVIAPSGKSLIGNVLLGAVQRPRYHNNHNDYCPLCDSARVSPFGIANNTAGNCSCNICGFSFYRCRTRAPPDGTDRDHGQRVLDELTARTNTKPISNIYNQYVKKEPKTPKNDVLLVPVFC